MLSLWLSAACLGHCTSFTRAVPRGSQLTWSCDDFLGGRSCAQAQASKLYSGYRCISSLWTNTLRERPRTKQNKTKQNKTKQNKTKQNKNKTKQNKTKQNKPNQTKKTPYNTKQHQTGSDRFVTIFVCCDFMAERSGQIQSTGAARRRRERRLRSMLRHEQQTVRMAMAAALHHSACLREVVEMQQKGAPTEPEDSHQDQGGGNRDELFGEGPGDPSLPRCPAHSSSQ